MTFIIVAKIVFTPVLRRWLTTMISQALIVIYWIKVKYVAICRSYAKEIYTLQHSHKLNFYYKIKTNYSPSVYLDLTRKDPSRKTLVKLRISSHKLRIETGRYDHIAPDERLCSLCNCIRVEDETHFLLDCLSFSSILIQSRQTANYLSC